MDIDKALIKQARTLPVEQYLALLAELRAEEDRANAVYQAARDRLGTALMIGLDERPEVNRQRMADSSRIPYRAIYKRADEVGEELLAG